MLLRNLRQVVLWVLVSSGGAARHAARVMCLLVGLQMPTVAEAGDVILDDLGNPPGFHAVDVEVQGMWQIEATVLLRCPSGEKVESISYDLPPWKGSGGFGWIPLDGNPAGEQIFTLLLPEVHEDLCPNNGGGNLGPPAFELTGNCSKLHPASSSSWNATVEVDALVKCKDDIPEDVHEPTIRVETGGPPDDPPPIGLEFFTVVDSDNLLDTDPGFGVRFRRSVSSRFNLEVGLSRSRISPEFIGSGSSVLWTFDFNGVVYQPLNDRFRWLFLGGIGWQFTSDEAFQATDDQGASLSSGPWLAPSLGLGLELQLSSRVSIETRVLGRYRTNSFEDDWSVEGQVGFVFHLGH